MKNLVVAVLVVASLSLVGFLYFRTRELEDALSEERTKRALQVKPHPDATTAASKHGDNSRTDIRANGGSTTSTAQSSTTFSSLPVSTGPSMELADRTRLDRIRAKVRERYQPLLATLGLTADGSETLLTMIALRRDAEVRAVNAAREKGEDMNGIAVKQQSATAQDELEAAIRAQFGESVLHQYRQHEWRLSATDLIAAAETSLKETPFSPQQREQLAVVLTQQYRAQPGSGRGIDPVPYRITVDEQLIRMIQTIATPEQVAPFLRFKALQETPSSRPPGTRK